VQPEQFRLFAKIELDHWWFSARREILRDVVQQVVPRGVGATIVDVGCGAGGNIAALSGDYDCVGIDPSGDAIRWAKSRFPDVRFMHGHAPDDLDGAAREARLFLVTDVLEHVADDFSLVSSLLSVAQPGAYLLATVPADLSLWSKHDEANDHYRRYDAARLQRLWRDLPVDELIVSHFNTRLSPMIRLVRAVNRRLGRVSGEAGLDARMPGPLTNAVLKQIFLGERTRLRQALRSRRPGYRQGVSLLALIRKRETDIVPITRPADVEPDYFDPATRRYSRRAA
jgi:SAM-dependent methyltransferase